MVNRLWEEAAKTRAAGEDMWRQPHLTTLTAAALHLIRATAFLHRHRSWARRGAPPARMANSTWLAGRWRTTTGPAWRDETSSAGGDLCAPSLRRRSAWLPAWREYLP